MNANKETIDDYLKEVKAAILAGNYRLEMNERRRDNVSLFFEYVIDEAKCREILLSLEVSDFSEVLNNKNKKYKDELLYVFGKDVDLLQRFGSKKEKVGLYIKFNKLDNNYIIVISFHKQKYPINYMFK